MLKPIIYLCVQNKEDISILKKRLKLMEEYQFIVAFDGSQEEVLKHECIFSPYWKDVPKGVGKKLHSFLNKPTKVDKSSDRI